MARRLAAWLAAAIPLVAPADTWAQRLQRVDPTTQGEMAVRAYPVAELDQTEGFAPEVYGSREPDYANWRASLFHKLSQTESCTSALVSARVLLTAAHCVARNGAQLHFTIRLPGRPDRAHVAVCTRHADYPLNGTSDYALCHVEPPVEGVSFERIATASEQPGVHDPILLTGFGCTDYSGAGRSRVGAYRIGDANVMALPFPPQNNSMLARGEAALCFGDSGGPAFVVRGERRYIVSVNSRIGRDAQGQPSRTSLLSGMGTEAADTFVRTWIPHGMAARPADLKICGLDEEATGCR